MAPSVTSSGAGFASAWALRPLRDDLDPLAAFAALRRDGLPWLLDSAEVSDRLGGWSFAGADPYAVVRARVGDEAALADRVDVEVRRGVRPDLPVGRRAASGDPFEVARTLLPPRPVARIGDRGEAGAGLPPFLGGAVAAFGYELAQRTWPLRLRARDDLGLPDLVLLLVDRVLAFDRRRGRAFAVGLGFAGDGEDASARAEAAAASLAARMRDVPPLPPVPSAPPEQAARSAVELTGFFDESRYGKAVEAIRARIAAGDVYQGCLTERLETPWSGEGWDLYRTLRAINPAPFACYLELPEVSVLGSSPERFLKLSPDGVAESRPIKGTRPRGVTPAGDRALAEELAGSAKDRAENLMIVDLVRNDLGRVCEIGSIEVPELFRVESYATLHQLVSTIRGRLAPGRDVLDAVRACFPPGSMTGAPKLAAMLLLDRLEPVRRGFYAGALGYLDVRGGAELCVVIRTLLLAGGRAYVHAGGGVVADSDPVDEYREARDKARALEQALARSG